MLSTRRSEIAPARSKRWGSDLTATTGSTGAMLSADMSGKGLFMPRASNFYVGRDELLAVQATRTAC